MMQMVMPYLTEIAAGVAVVALIVAIWALVAAGQAKKRLHLELAGVSRLANGDGWSEALAKLNDLPELESRIGGRIDELENQQSLVISRLGLVRYNAFEDTGADLSFSLAILTDQGNGIVLTSLWGRDEVRVYAKPLESLSSRYALSNEEKQALDLARSQRRAP